MTRRTLLAALASAALLAACDKNSGENVSPVSITSFGIYAEDNTQQIENDIIATEISGDVIELPLPYGFVLDSLKNVVVRFTATEGSVVNIADESGMPSGEAIVSRVSALDLSGTAQLIVSKDNNYKVYNVTHKIESSKWDKLAETSLSMKTDPVLTVNPTDGAPYLAGAETETSFPHLFKFDGGVLKDVAGALKETESSAFALDFNPYGTPFVSFSDKSAGSKQTVVYVNGSEVGYIGEAGTLPAVSVASNNPSAVFPLSSSNVWSAFCLNRAADGVAKRGLYLSEYNGTDWMKPKIFANSDASKNAAIIIGRYRNDKFYMFICNVSIPSFSVYSYSTTEWTPVLENVKIKTSDGASDAIFYKSPRPMDMDIDSKGNVYVYACADFNTDGTVTPGVVRIDPATGSQTLIGGSINDFENFEGHMTFSLAIGKDDAPHIVNLYKAGSSYRAYYRTIDSKTKTWAEPELIYDRGADYAVIRTDKDGKPYVALRDDDTDKYVLFGKAE